MIISYTEFDLFNFSKANAFKGELRSQASVCFIRILPTFSGFLLIKLMEQTSPKANPLHHSCQQVPARSA